jgi:hypothetical protein
MPKETSALAARADDDDDHNVIPLEVDIFSTDVMVDNLLQFYRHFYAINDRSVTEPRFRVVLTAHDKKAKTAMTPAETSGYLATVHTKLYDAGEEFKTLHGRVGLAAWGARREVAPEEWAVVDARFHSRHLGVPAKDAGETGGKCACACASASDHPTREEFDAKGQALADKIRELEVEIKALREETSPLRAPSAASSGSRRVTGGL